MDGTSRRSLADYLMVLPLVGAIVLVVVGTVRTRSGDDATPEPPPPTRSVEPPTLDEMGATCRERPQAWPGTAEYTGNGPHPIAVYDSGFPTAKEELSELGAGWHAATAAHAQLIVCVGYTVHERIEVCEFTGTDGREVEAPVFSVDYLFRIFTARTGAQLGDDTAFTDEFTCPTSVVYHPDEGPPGFNATLPREEVQEILAPWVNAIIG